MEGKGRFLNSFIIWNLSIQQQPIVGLQADISLQCPTRFSQILKSLRFTGNLRSRRTWRGRMVILSAGQRNQSGIKMTCNPEICNNAFRLFTLYVCTYSVKRRNALDFLAF